MSWVYLDDKFHSNPKVLQAGNEAAGVFARALSYCGDHLTDGFVPAGFARTLAPLAILRKCEKVGFFRRVPGGFQIPDYLELNPSKAKVLAKRKERREAGLKGAEARWKDAKSDSSSHGNRHSTSHGKTYGTPHPQSHASLNAPQPLTPQTVDLEGGLDPTAAAENNGARDPLLLQLENIGWSQKQVAVAATDRELTSAWLERAVAVSAQNVAGFVWAGVSSGQLPQGVEPKAKSAPSLGYVHECPICTVRTKTKARMDEHMELIHGQEAA